MPWPRRSISVGQRTDARRRLLYRSQQPAPRTVVEPAAAALARPHPPLRTDMISTTILIATLLLLTAAAGAVWTWLTVTRLEQDLRALSGFEGRHFEIGRQITQSKEGSRWPIPG